MRVTLALVLLLATSVAAQDKPEPRFRIGVALAAGTFDADLGPTLDDDTDAGFFRLQFEYIGESRLGGGLRIESFASDDDLFGTGPAGSEATNGSLFGHFTYRLGGDRFDMPLRAGLLGSNLTVEQNGSSAENEALSVGLYAEVAPELTLIHVGPTRWTVYGELGAGLAATEIEVSATPEEFDSDTLFYGVEIGTRLRLGMFEAGLGFLARFQETDDSDVENGFFVPEFNTTFSGVLLSAALRF